MTNVSVCVWLDRAEVIQVETNFQLNYVKQNDRVFSTTTNGATNNNNRQKKDLIFPFSFHFVTLQQHWQ